MKGKYTVAVCDILGFTDLIQRYSLEQVVNDHLAWLRKSLSHAIHKGDFPADVPTLGELQDQSQLGIAWFSDTILIYTLNDTEDALRALFSCLGWLLFEQIVGGALHLRCGVSYGVAHLDAQNSLYVGQPIIDAYHLEQSQAWSGGALTAAAAERVPQPIRSDGSLDWFLSPYHVPLQNGGTVETLAVDWTAGLHPSPLHLRWSNTHDVPTPEDWQQHPRICEKLKNTKGFHDDVCLYCRGVAARET